MEEEHKFSMRDSSFTRKSSHSRKSSYKDKISMTNKKHSVKVHKSHLSVNLLKRFDNQDFVPQSDQEIKDYLKYNKSKW